MWYGYGTAIEADIRKRWSSLRNWGADEIDKSDRRLLIWASVFWCFDHLALAILSQEEEESAIPSTYSGQNHGARRRICCWKAGYKVERWEQSPTELPRSGKDGAGARQSFSITYARRKKCAAKYLSRGGKIIATDANASVIPARGGDRA